MKHRISKLVHGLPAAVQGKFRLLSIRAAATGHKTVNVRITQHGVPQLLGKAWK